MEQNFKKLDAKTVAMECRRIFVLYMNQKYEIIYGTKIKEVSTILGYYFKIFSNVSRPRMKDRIIYRLYWLPLDNSQGGVYLSTQWCAIIYTRADSLNTVHAMSTLHLFMLHNEYH